MKDYYALFQGEVMTKNFSVAFSAISIKHDTKFPMKDITKIVKIQALTTIQVLHEYIFL